jgi:magnesium-transporting ATPase (P-type)
MIVYANSDGEITQQDLDSCNIEQARASNRENLDGLGGADSLARKLRVDMSRGLTHAQVLNMRNKFGSNEFPESPMSTFLELFLESFEDTIIIILMFAAIISLAIGMWEHPTTGWIEGTAILIAVLLVALVTSGNNYTKELQFRALEKSSQRDERCSVLRNGVIDRINPIDVVVGDILILQVPSHSCASSGLTLAIGWRCNSC